MTLTFKASDLTLHRVIEMETPFLPARDMLPDLTEEVLAENRAWMQPAALTPDDTLILCVQSWVVRTPHHTILVDTCVGNDKPRARAVWNMRTDETYMRALAAHGMTVDDIDYVMCTHLHPDHIGWNTRLVGGKWMPTFPNARYIIGRIEYDNASKAHAANAIPMFADSVAPVVDAGLADFVEETHAIGDHVRLMHTPGHTAGHVAIRFGRDHDDAVMTGDLIHSPLQARYPELSVKFDVDKVQAAQTRRRFLEQYCDTDTLCCTSHFPSPSAGRIKRWGDGFRCEPVG